MALSGYLPLADRFAAERHAANADTPIFMAHGTQDPVVILKRGEDSRDALAALGHPRAPARDCGHCRLSETSAGQRRVSGVQTRPLVLGIDFGTSNSAVACRVDGAARLLPIEGAATTLPTAIFFNSEDRTTHFGRDAIAQYLSGTEGRLMRSLKSLLGSALMQEKTAIYDGLVSFEDII
eukprot:gene38815-62386_t